MKPKMQLLYKAQAEAGAQGGAQQGQPEGGNGNAEGGDDVQDVDFEEVK